MRAAAGSSILDGRMRPATCAALSLLAACGGPAFVPPPKSLPAADGGGPVAPPDVGTLPNVVYGGALASLDFGVVGDTRPLLYDMIDGYPVGVITALFRDLAALSPPVAFVAATGDYMFADPIAGDPTAQAQRFVLAASAFPGPVFAAMGNHECGWTLP